MEREQYVNAEIEIIRFTVEDVITASDGGDETKLIDP